MGCELKILLVAGALCMAAMGVAGESVQNKLDKLIINRVEMKDVTIGEAVDYLRKTSRELDPEKSGVNFVFSDVDQNGARIDVDLADLPLGEALKYICLSAGVAYRVEKYAVVITNRAKKESPGAKPRK